LQSNNNIIIDDVSITEDSAITLTYSVIMLNVDQHSPVLNEKLIRMKLSNYISNLRGLNGGKDYPLYLLEIIFQGVSTNEIKIHKEHYLRTLTDTTWSNMYKHAKIDGKTIFVQTRDCAG